jgi:linoleoyl-CoA desaturase
LGNSPIFTTTNFVQKKNCKLVHWWIKSPNRAPYFSNISHIHYGKIAKIVKETAAECNHRIMNTNNGAVIAHFKHLKELGMKPAM